MNATEKRLLIKKIRSLVQTTIRITHSEDLVRDEIYNAQDELIVWINLLD